MRLVGAGREHQVGVLTFITSAIPVIFGIKMLDRNDEMRPESPPESGPQGVERRDKRSTHLIHCVGARVEQSNV